MKFKRKGFDKSIWIVVMVVMALLFSALWFGGVSGWIDSSAGQLLDISDNWRDIG